MAKNEKRSVLLVDDNEATCTLVTAILQREFHVDVALEGAEALERLRTRRYAAVLLDLRMPQIDGFAILDHLKTSQPALLPSVIVLTASVTTDILSRAAQYGVHCVVTKPFELDELLNAVRTCAGPEESNSLGMIYSGTGMILLLAEMLRKGLM
jgi:CheY-like chemotaxis protein